MFDFIQKKITKIKKKEKKKNRWWSTTFFPFNLKEEVSCASSAVSLSLNLRNGFISTCAEIFESKHENAGD